MWDGKTRASHCARVELKLHLVWCLISILRELSSFCFQNSTIGAGECDSRDSLIDRPLLQYFTSLEPETTLSPGVVKCQAIEGSTNESHRKLCQFRAVAR